MAKNQLKDLESLWIPTFCINSTSVGEKRWEHVLKHFGGHMQFSYLNFLNSFTAETLRVNSYS